MLKFFKRIKGIVLVEIQGTLYEALLNKCAFEGIALWDFELPEQYTVRAHAYESQLEALEALSRATGCELKLLKLSGGSDNRRLLGRRKWLLIFISVLMYFIVLIFF